MAGRAAQIDLTVLSLEELHWLMDAIVRRQQVLRAALVTAPKASAASGSRPSSHAGPASTVASPPTGQGRDKYMHGLRPKSAMMPKPGSGSNVSEPGVPAQPAPTTTTAGPRASVPHPAATPNGAAPADRVMDTHAVFDPWSHSGSLPVMYQWPYYQGQQIFVAQTPPQRNLRLDVANLSPPNFGAGDDATLPEAESSALVPAHLRCPVGCLYCGAPCCIPVDKHLNSVTHLCQGHDLEIAHQ